MECYVGSELVLSKKNNIQREKQLKLLPFIISRRCNISHIKLANLQSTKIFFCLDEINNFKKEEACLIEKAVDLLFHEIPKAEPEDQKNLLNLKRDIYNKRKNLSRYRELLNKYNIPSLGNDINKILDISKQLEISYEDLNKIYEEQSLKTGYFLARLCNNEAFLKAIQLSGSRLLSDAKYYYRASSNNQKSDKKLRQIEESLLSYFCRMALKPSPFASFSVIKLYATELQKKHFKNSQYQFCVTSRAIIDWIINQCFSIPKLRDNFPIRLNTTCDITEEVISFFSYSDLENKNIYGSERFISIKNTIILKDIISALQFQSKSKMELLERFKSSKFPFEELSAFLEKLIQNGFLERYIPIPDMTLRYANAASDCFRHFDEPISQELSRFFSAIDNIELKFEVADIYKRAALLNDFKKTFDQLIEFLKLDDPGLSHARNFLYEDLGEVDFTLATEASYFQAYKADLNLLKTLYTLVDNSIIERMSLYDYFKDLYPKEGEKTALMDFYKKFAKLPITELAKIMSGANSENVTKIRALRKSWTHLLDDELAQASNKDVISINAKWLLSFKKATPDYCDNVKSMIFYLQKCMSNNSPAVMCNGVSMGYGAFYSRFCSIYEQEKNYVNSMLYKALQETQTGVDNWFDICAVLGANTNLHPDILKNTLEYPGALSDQKQTDSKTYTLNELLVKADDIEKKLILIHRETHKEVKFRPQNFLYPAVGPNLYRFLYLFTPFVNFKGGIWRNHIKNRQFKKAQIFPRLMVNKVVLDRKTWFFPLKSVPDFILEKRNEAKCLLDITAWRKQHNIPEKVFYHQLPNSANTENWLEMMKTHVMQANKNKLRKPHYLDFSSPMLIRLFIKHLDNVKYNLVFQECLPNVELIDNQRDGFVEEFLIQIDENE